MFRHFLSRFRPWCLPLLLGLAGTVPHAAGENLRSEKRGVSANNLTSDQIALLAPGVSWVYNWGPAPGGVQVTDEMEFIPFVWGRDQGQLDGVKSYLDGGARPSAIFFLNEPNFDDALFLGSGVPPLEAAEWLETVRETLSDYSEIPIIGPHMALGSAPEDSITAFDPIQETEVTYTTALSYLDAYDFYVGDNPTDAVGVHSYQAGEMEFWVDTFYERSGAPVWVTEFALIGSTDEDVLYDYLLQTLDYLERSPKVARYAWFKADVSNQNTALKLLQTRVPEATLTRLGELYVNFPAFHPDHFYAVPCKIEAESYSERQNMALVRADAPDGWGALRRFSTRSYGAVSYQIEVPENGRYRMRMRTSSEAYDDLGAGAPSAQDPDPPEGRERDLIFHLDLEAGQQTLQLLLFEFNVKLDWIEIVPAG